MRFPIVLLPIFLLSASLHAQQCDIEHPPPNDNKWCNKNARSATQLVALATAQWDFVSTDSMSSAKSFPSASKSLETTAIGRGVDADKTETIYAMVGGYPHSINKARLAQQGKQSRVFGALDGTFQGTMTSNEGLKDPTLHISRLCYVNGSGSVDLGVTIPLSLTNCPPPPPQKKTTVRRSNRKASCEHFQTEANEIGGPVGRCQLMCMYRICIDNNGVQAAPLLWSAMPIG